MTPEELSRLHYDTVGRGVLPIWTIYDRPKDFPGGIIARMFEIGKGKGTPAPTDHMMTGKLEDLRRAFMAAGLARIPRFDDDEPPIVESWV